MQLTGRPPAPADASRATPSRNPVLDEYEARRCAICGAKYPPFGFGPPLTRPDAMLWACSAHQTELHASLSRRRTDIEVPIKRPSLFF